MDFVTGAKGTVQPYASPTISSIYCVATIKAISGAAGSFVVSYIASAWAKCRD
ncbi:type 2 lantibiotic [Oceanivirga salmonicida]|nr:type 2 lantibiotic [Oceanivirga salmonicida]